jgi:DNA invertase Pin-like site-specific DNA recombinase
VILVHKFDRFARSREDSVVYKSLLRKECGVKVVSITESIEDDKFSVILEAMLEAMAEYYSLNLAEEVRKGMTEKAERGEYQTRPPFGYTMGTDKILRILEDEAKIVQLIFDSFINKGMSQLQISRIVNDLGIKTKHNGSFQKRAIYYILNNPVYIGKARWNPTEYNNGRFDNPGTIIRDSEHEPIIDMETWDKAQQRLIENKEIFRMGESTGITIRTWLKGLVKCSICGRAFALYSKYRYMQCNGYLKGSCTQSSNTPVAKLENAVLEELKKTYTGRININIVPSATDTTANLEYEILQDSLNRIDGKEERINTAYEDGIDTIDEYKDKKQRLSEERKKLIKALEVLKSGIIENRHNNDIVSKMTDVYELLTDETVDIETKYQTAHLLIEKITYSKAEKVLKLTYK